MGHLNRSVYPLFWSDPQMNQVSRVPFCPTVCLLKGCTLCLGGGVRPVWTFSQILALCPFHTFLPTTMHPSAKQSFRAFRPHPPSDSPLASSQWRLFFELLHSCCPFPTSAFVANHPTFSFVETDPLICVQVYFLFMCV